MNFPNISGTDIENDDCNDDINRIIQKYESNIMILNNNKNETKIKNNEIIQHKNTDFTSQHSKRTKNSSNNSDKNYENNNINIKLYEDDLNKNNSSSIVNKSIKTNTNSNKINKNDIEINFEQDNIKNNNIYKRKNEKDINNNQLNLQNNKYILTSLEKNYKTEKNNISIYDTSFNKLYNPYDYSKFFLNKPNNISLLKNKDSLKIIKNIINIQEEQLKKENNKLPIKNNIIKKINNEDNYIKNKYKNYLNKLFKREKTINIIKKEDNLKYNLNNRSKKCKCKCNILNIIRNILLFIIVSSALTFYIFVFFNL